MTEAQVKQVRELLHDNEVIFSTGDIGQTHLVEHRIDTGDKHPIRQPLRRQPFKHLDFIDRHIEEMKAHGRVEPAASPWASNVVLVKKQDGSLRLVWITEGLML